MSYQPAKKATSFDEKSTSNGFTHPAVVRRVRTVTKISEHRSSPKPSEQTQISPPVSIPSSLNSSQENVEPDHPVNDNNNENQTIATTQYEIQVLDNDSSDDSGPIISKDLLQFSKLTRSNSNYGSSQVPENLGASPESPKNTYIDLRLPVAPDSPRRITRSNSPIINLMEDTDDETLHDNRYKGETEDTAHVTDYSTMDESKPETLHASNYSATNYSTLNEQTTSAPTTTSASSGSKTQYQSVDSISGQPSKPTRNSTSGIVMFNSANLINLYQIESSSQKASPSGYFPSEDLPSVPQPQISTFSSSSNASTYRSVSDLPAQEEKPSQSASPIEQYNTFTTSSSNLNNNNAPSSNNSTNYVSVTTSQSKPVGRKRQDSTLHSRTDVGIHRDWNGEYQETVEMKDSYDKFVRLRDLASDFCYCAQTYGVIIISELCLPHEEKTIKPVKLGGIAGGEKYICRGIFFKFAIDENGLYGGDEHAQKAAGHDLNGLMNYRNCDVGLSFPLMVLIDYRGFRLVALSILPVSKNTIIYGSHDAGSTAHADDPNFNSLMEQTAKIMNIKGHMVGKHELKMIHGPGDIEGHRGTDGRYYCLDFARYMPPEPPIPGLKGAILYRLLRPELVARYTTPLSPDAFCVIGLHDKQVHNEEVRQAFHYLQSVVIPKAANELAAAEETDYHKIRDALHTVGINIRYMGLVRSQCAQEKVRGALLREMIARVMKCEIRGRQREEMRYKGFPAEQPYIKIVVEYVNAILTENKPFERELLEAVQEKFMGALSQEELEQGVQLDDYERYAIFKRLCTITGIKMRKKHSETGKMTFLLVSDVERMTTNIKQLNLVDYADGMACLLDAKESSNAEERKRLLNVSKEKLLIAQSSFSANVDCSLQLAKVIYGICKNEKGTPFGEVYEVCERILKMNEKHYTARVLWARALYHHTKLTRHGVHHQENEKALKLLQEAIQLKPEEPEAYAKAIRVYRARSEECKTWTEKEDIKFQFCLQYLKDGLKMAKQSLEKFKSNVAICAQAMLLGFDLLVVLQDSKQKDEDLESLRTMVAFCCEVALPEKSSYWKQLSKKVEGPKQFWYLFQVAVQSQTLRNLFLNTCTNISLEYVTLSDNERDKVLLLVQSAPMESIDLSHCEGFSKEAYMHVLKELAQKHIISFKHRSCEFMDNEVALSVASFSRLKTLDLNDTPGLNDTLLDTIISSCLHIESLHLRGNNLSEAILVKAIKLLPLEGIFIGRITLPSITSLVDALAASLIKVLEIQGNTILVLDDIKKICAGNSRLAELDLAGCTSISSEEILDINYWSDSIKKVRTPSGVPLLYSAKQKVDFRLTNAGMNNRKFNVLIDDVTVYVIDVDTRLQDEIVSLAPLHKSNFRMWKQAKPQEFDYENNFEVAESTTRSNTCPPILNFSFQKRGAFATIFGQNTLGKKPVSLVSAGQWQAMKTGMCCHTLKITNELLQFYISNFGSTSTQIRITAGDSKSTILEMGWKFMGTSLPGQVTTDRNVNIALMSALMVLGIIYSK